MADSQTTVGPYAGGWVAKRGSVFLASGMTKEEVQRKMTAELRRVAFMICMASDTGRITPRCSEPCPWCLNEAHMELEAESNAE